MYAICGIGNWGHKLLQEFSKTQNIKYFCCKSLETAELVNKNFPNLERASVVNLFFDF